MNKEFDDRLVRFRKLPMPVRVVVGRPRTFTSIVVGIVGRDRVTVEPEFERAMEVARDSADEAERGAVLVTGSITLVGEAITLAAAEKWKP